MLPIGTMIIFKNEHPHAGEKGKVVGHENIFGKERHKIRLEDCKHGVEVAFAMNLKDVKIV